MTGNGNIPHILMVMTGGWFMTYCFTHMINIDTGPSDHHSGVQKSLQYPRDFHCNHGVDVLSTRPVWIVWKHKGSCKSSDLPCFFFFIKHIAKLLNLVQNLVKILDFQNSPQPFVRFFVIACVANLAEGWWLWAPVKKNGAAESHLTSIHPHFARSYCGRQNHIWIKVSRQNLRALG